MRVLNPNGKLGEAGQAHMICIRSYARLGARGVILALKLKVAHVYLAHACAGRIWEFLAIGYLLAL